MNPFENSSKSSEPEGNTLLPVKVKQVSKSKNHCFTWNNYKSEDVKILVQKFQDLNIKYIFQEEIGDEKETPHLQGFIECPKKMRDTEFKLPKQIHWENCRGNKTENIAYCTKLQTRNGKIHANIPYDEPLEILKEENMYHWQKEILKTIQKKPNNRKIYWFWEEKGCAGKTVFCKYLIIKHYALCLSGKSSDAFHGIVNYKEKNGCFPKIVLFDIPRNDFDYLNYTTIEKVKDGCFFSGKYDSNQLVFNSPHVFVFSNKEPDKEMLSKDRWNIVNIYKLNSKLIEKNITPAPRAP